MVRVRTRLSALRNGGPELEMFILAVTGLNKRDTDVILRIYCKRTDVTTFTVKWQSTELKSTCWSCAGCGLQPLAWSRHLSFANNILISSHRQAGAYRGFWVYPQMLGVLSMLPWTLRFWKLRCYLKKREGFWTGRGSEAPGRGQWGTCPLHFQV